MASVWFVPVLPPSRARRLVVDVDPAGVVVGGGVGGWAEQDMDRQANVALWGSRPLLTMDVPIIVTGIGHGPKVRGRATDRSVEPSLAWLMRWGQPTAATGEPPVFQLHGAVPLRSTRWVLQSVDWDAGATLNTRGERTFATATLHLLEYRAASVLVSSTRPKPRHRTTTVVRSDLPVGLPRVAARTLHNSGRWREIARLNRNRKGKTIRDPRDIYVGQRLTLP